MGSEKRKDLQTYQMFTPFKNVQLPLKHRKICVIVLYKNKSCVAEPTYTTVEKYINRSTAFYALCES